MLWGRIALAGALALVAVAPAWWVAGRLQEPDTRPFFRLLTAIGIALVGYLTFVNLLGRAVGHSTTLAVTYFALSAALAVFVRRRWPDEARFASLRTTWRDWAVVVLIACVVGLPQWVLAVSSPFWDEVASSAIHVTAANQFAEGVFPPRHNALPDVVIKYHYGFTILSGTVHWLTGLSANASIDLVSTALWLFAFLFVVYWLRDLRFERAAALWGGTAALLGGGLAWMFLRRVESYDGFEKSPPAALLSDRYDGARGFAENLLGTVREPSAHLRNPDGTLSNLPWDIAAQFQQHAVALGIPLAVFALYLFVRWQTRRDGRTPLLVLVIATFGVLMLGHAVFGGVAAVTGGLVLLAAWLRDVSRRGFTDGLAFGIGVAVVAFMHGGLLATGAEYGASADVLTTRGSFGYPDGGIVGFLNWNVAGFGVPLVLALVAWGARSAWRDPSAPRARGRRAVHEIPAREFAFYVISVFALFSYLVPQVAFYSSENSGVEQFTEISKFFFTARLGFALVSAYGVAWLVRRVHWGALVPAAAAMAVTPLAFTYMHATTAATIPGITTPAAATAVSAAADTTPAHKWLGFYRAPYFRQSVEEQMATTLRAQKRSNRDVYFDASADERKRGYLSEMLIFGGSVFTLTPSRYERTGSGYRLSADVVAKRMVQNGRMARLRPGAAEECGCTWYYGRPALDMLSAPMIVRARFDKFVANGTFVERLAGGGRVLYSIEKPTADADSGIAAFWRPRVVMQAQPDWDGDGRMDLIFHDVANRTVVVGDRVIDAPPLVHDEFAQLFVGRFPGDRRADLLFARTRDTEFRLGKRIDDIVERSTWGWMYRASTTGTWAPEYERWLWDVDTPLIADLDNDGYDTHLTFHRRTGEWYAAPATKLAGPTMDAAQLPVPFAGRFLQGSAGDLGLWSRATGNVVLQSLSNGRRVEFDWGGSPGEVLVPGDYTGDGYDEIAVWNANNQFWYWRRAPDGANTQFRFGTPTAVPVPADYNSDGRVDPAYWEPSAGKIYVTYSFGRSVDLVITVPPGSIPAFVNMH